VPPEFDRKNTSFVMRRTGFESSWRIESGDATVWGYFLHQPFGHSQPLENGSDESRGDPVHLVLARARPGVSKWVRKRSDEASRCRFDPCLLDDCSHAALAQTEEARGSDPRC
jgi:hypothetical protein